jgi:parallel beta-helix repeat protein
VRRVVPFAIVLALVSTFLSAGQEAHGDEFVPYIPDPSRVGLTYWEQSHVPCMNVTIEFWDTGYAISSWGTPNIAGRNISVDAEIWRWTGLSNPVVFTLSYTHSLGPLPPGEYQFFFAVWGALVRNVTFLVSPLVVPDDYATIQEAIDDASDGNTIIVRSGMHAEYVNVTKSLSLRGENVQSTVVIGFEVHADNVAISGFTMHAGSYTGVEVAGFSYCNISDNIIFADFYPIGLMHSVRNHISDNRIQCIVYGSGITLIDCNATTISQNKLASGEVGIHLMESYNNTLCGNSVANFSIGVSIGGLVNDYHNLIYRNNLINNQEGATDLTGANLWDNGCEGNYWSDYQDRYPNASFDIWGIGDTPYLIDAGSQDTCPLLNVFWNPCDTDHDLDVDIFDLIKVCHFYGVPYWSEDCCHVDLAAPYGEIDIFDIVTIAMCYGEAYTP